MPSLNAIFRIVCCTVILAALTSLPSPAHALTIENTTFADSITIGEKPVSLRGAALLRWLKLVKVYVAALYLPERTKPSEALSDIPKRLEISYLVAIKGADFGPAAEPILARNVSGAELAKTAQSHRPPQRRLPRYQTGRPLRPDLPAGQGHRTLPERGHRSSPSRGPISRPPISASGWATNRWTTI